MHIYENQNKYCIVYQNSMVINDINSDGTPCISTHPWYFNTEYEARDALRQMVSTAITINAPQLDMYKLDMYTIQNRIVQYFITPNPRALTELAYSLMSDKSNDLERMCILRVGVTMGFNKLGLAEDMIKNILTDPKYKDIVEKVVPRHMIENIDNFMDVGIKSCSNDELGAIMLTSSEDLLKFIEIDRYNISG